MGITVRTFRDPGGSNKAALIAEIPDMEAFQDFMKSDEAADAMSTTASIRRPFSF